MSETTTQVNPLAHTSAALSEFIAKEESNGAETGLAHEVASSLLAEVEAGGPTALKGLPQLKQAILDYALELYSDNDQEKS